jgi:membrane protein DedA with SNARE-associated domain
VRILVCVDDFLLWILDAVQAVDPVARTLIAGLAVMLETSILIGLIVPGDTIVIIASMGVDGPVEVIAMVVAVVVGALIGESIGFWLGRWLGPRIRRSWVGRRIGEAHWARAERYLQRRGGLAIFLSRFLPVLHSLVPLTVGMSTYSYRRFLAWTTPACVIWAAAYVSSSTACTSPVTCSSASSSPSSSSSCSERRHWRSGRPGTCAPWNPTRTPPPT